MNKYLAVARMMADPATWRWLLRWLEFSYAHHVTAIARLGKVGPGSWIEPSVKFTNPQNITIGSHCHINHMGCVQADRHSRITIGDHLRMGPGTGIFSSNHSSAKRSLIREQPMVEGDVVIGNDVWLGCNVVVTAGVTIGEGAVIAAGAVVTRDIPAYAVAAGVPARVLRYRE